MLLIDRDNDVERESPLWLYGKACIAFLAVLSLGLPLLVAAQQPNFPQTSIVLRPIIAELIADPGYFVGKQIEIYGLIIKVRNYDSVFLLQDVSQKPLAVRRPHDLMVKKGEQVLISGTLQVLNTGRLIFVAKSIVPEIVLGGCCE